MIVEDVVQSSPNGLELMYLRLLEFVPQHCRLLREVTGGAVSRYWCTASVSYLRFWKKKCWCVTHVCLCWVSDRADTVPGYDFLVNSVWPEMIRAIEERLSYLFNPGNPDVFYAVRGRLHPDSDSLLHSSASASPVALLQRYSVSMDFVRKFERQCSSQASVKRLRGHPSYTSFHNKWNLPVYFQLR